MRRPCVAAMICIPLALMIGRVAADQKQLAGETGGEDTTLPKCPVMGDPVNLAISVAGEHGPVFFCCSNCVSEYKEDPDKYADGVKAQREALADRPRIQVTCPVTREPIDRETYVQHEGRKVFFCCKNCIPKFEANPDKYEAALANSYTYQTECPVMGEEINPKVFTILKNGQRIYYCCARCDKKLFGHLSKYLPNLEKQGYAYRAGEMVPAAEGGKDASDDHEHGGHDHDH